MQQENLCLETTLRLDIAIPYRAYLPNKYNEKGNGYPLLLFLHGAGERGSDLEVMARIGLPNYIEGRAEPPFVLICPQCPNGEVWDVHALIALLDEVAGNYNIDLSRIYATGLSMGGGAVLGSKFLGKFFASKLHGSINLADFSFPKKKAYLQALLKK